MRHTRNFVVWTILGGSLALLAPLVGAACASLLFPGFRLVHLPLHAMVETAGGMTAVAIAAILLVQFAHRADALHFPWLAAGLAGMGVLDLFHAATSPGNLFVWLRCVASCVGGILFGLVWLAPTTPQVCRRFLLPLVATAASLAVGFASIGAPELLPAMRSVSGNFSGAALTLNLLGSAGFLSATAFFLRRFSRTCNDEDWTFGTQSALFGAAGIVFGYSVLWDGSWWWWHLLRLAAYVAAFLYGLRAFFEAEQELVRVNQQLRQTNVTLDQDRSLLQAIHIAQTQFITAEAPRSVFDNFLKRLVPLSESEYGFIGEMFSTPDRRPLLTIRAVSDISWNDESRRMYQQLVDGTLNFTTLNSLYGEVMTSGRPVIANDAPHDPRRMGTPPGHPPLKAFLGLPLKSSSGELVGVIGLANRPGGYADDVIAYLQPTVLACANLIAARKNDERRRQAEEELRQTRDELDVRVRQRTAELQHTNQTLQEEVAERLQAESTLQQRTKELERFNRLMVGREERMIELKRQVNECNAELGRPEPYDLSFLEQEVAAP